MSEEPRILFDRAGTGIEGLDEILGGGFQRDRLYVVEGNPGAGKTTLALQFLLEGVRRGESALYVTLSETREELLDVILSHGWSTEGIHVLDLQTAEETLKAESQYTLFHPSEIELGETTRSILEASEQLQPRRVVFDSLSEMQLLARDALRFRRQILALKHYFTARGCTVLLLDTASGMLENFRLQTLAHGVLLLEQLSPGYGGQRRRLRVQKMRAIPFRNGFHDFTIRTGGLVVHPRLVAAEHRQDVELELLPSGVPELDALLGGGLHRGTSTLLVGPAGVGKTTLAAQYLLAAAERGEPSAFYTFEEGLATWLARGAGLGLDLRKHVESGRIRVEHIDPAELSPGEFATFVRGHVEQGGVRIVVVDSLNGYRNAMPQEHFLTLHLHELFNYLNQQGVATLVVTAQHGFIGPGVDTDVELSYLADSVILLRYFEAFGRVRQAISVVKKRGGRHDRTIRELHMSAGGVDVGQELREFQGVLSGELRYQGQSDGLLRSTDVPGAD